MGYHPMNQADMYEMVRRWHGGQSISDIARTENRDRKTVREVIRKIQGTGVCRDKPLPEKDILISVFEEWGKKTERQRLATEELVKMEQEIRQAITGTEELDGMKPKTAYLAVKEKFGLQASYGTFKNFARQRGFGREHRGLMLRIETEPGKEAQLDYGQMGIMFDPHEKRKRFVHGYVMILSSSRLPFIQYTYKQKQEDFARSTRDAFEFFGGVPERLSLDNLKAGVIKPDLYDPKLNRTFGELVEHYSTFADPCRIRKATDKGKVERHVPVARELYRYLRYMHPNAGLNELNMHAKKWCLETYGMREHGTTHEKPKEVFETLERAVLKPLPEERYEIATWKNPTVAPDQFLVFEKKRYSLPAEYRGAKVWARGCGKKVEIYQDCRKLREYVVPQGPYAFLPGDFPGNKQEMMEGKYPSYILTEAKGMGEVPGALMEAILTPHAYVRARRGRGVLEVMRKYKDENFFQKICGEAFEKKVSMPKVFAQMMKEEADQMELFGEPLPVSATGRDMTRDGNYYFEEVTNESETSSGNGHEKAEAVGNGTNP